MLVRIAIESHLHFERSLEIFERRAVVSELLGQLSEAIETQRRLLILGASARRLFEDLKIQLLTVLKPLNLAQHVRLGESNVCPQFGLGFGQIECALLQRLVKRKSDGERSDLQDIQWQPGTRSSFSSNFPADTAPWHWSRWFRPRVFPKAPRQARIRRA